MHGTPAAAMAPGAHRDRAITAGLQVLDQLHEATGRRIVVDSEMMGRWVHEPVARVAAVVTDHRGVRGLAALQARLEAELTGQAGDGRPSPR